MPLDKKSVLGVINDRLIDINVHLDIEEAIRVVFAGQLAGISFTIDVPQLRTIRLVVESSVIERIGWMDHLTVKIYDQTGPRAKFVTSCRMLPDGLHSGFFGMFPYLVKGHNYYIQFN